jgi:HlyD family secretion protein
MNRILWPLGILVLVASVVGAGWVLQYGTPHPGNDDNDRNDPLPVVSCLAIADVEDGVADLYPKQPGQVAEIANTRFTDKDGIEHERPFKKGDVLLRLHSEMAELQLGQAKTALEAAQAELAKANTLGADRKVKLDIQTAAIEAAKFEKKRLEEDLEVKKKAVKDKIGEQPETMLRMMQAAVDEAKEKIKIEQGKLEAIKLIDPDLEVKRARADAEAKRLGVKIAEENLKDFRIEAPFDGIVLRVHTRVGEPLGPNPKSAAIEFCPNAQHIARAEVIQEWGHRVRVGQEALIQDDVYQGPEWKGRVKSLSPWYAPKRMRVIEPFMTNDVRTLECIVEFADGQSPTRIGQRLRVKIKI